MSKFSAEERQQILDEARARAAGFTPGANSQIEDCIAEPRPDPLAAWLHTMPKPEPAPREQTLDTLPIDWARVIDVRLADERKFLIEVMGEALGEALAEARKQSKDELTDEVRSLKIELANLDSTIAELRRALADERGRAVDLPNPLSARRGLQ